MRLNDAATATLTIVFDSVVVLPPFDDGLLWKRLERAAVASARYRVFRRSIPL
jgi:hypothetical protein